MNRLPAVLQKEIWEYVRGDRAYWRTQFTNVMEQLEQIIELIEDEFHDGVNMSSWQSRTSGIVANAKSRLNWRLEPFPVLSWRRFLSRHNHPMYCDSLADYRIHVQAFSEFRS
jgi:hypothetical protein